MYLFFSFSFKYIISCILVLWLFSDSKHCIYPWYIFDDVVIIFTYLIMCYFFSLFKHMFLLYVCNLLFLFHTKMPWWVLFKVFQKGRLSKSSMPWTLFLQNFSRVCVRVDLLYLMSDYELSDLWLPSYFIYWLWFCHRLPQGEIVKTYVEHVMNICHIELANHLTKCTLLLIG